MNIDSYLHSLAQAYEYVSVSENYACCLHGKLFVVLWSMNWVHAFSVGASGGRFP